jgi:hypothetical protein
VDLAVRIRTDDPGTDTCQAELAYNMERMTKFVGAQGMVRAITA